jgi:hypothetical protein
VNFKHGKAQSRGKTETMQVVSNKNILPSAEWRKGKGLLT